MLQRLLDGGFLGMGRLDQIDPYRAFRQPGSIPAGNSVRQSLAVPYATSIIGPVPCSGAPVQYNLAAASLLRSAGSGGVLRDDLRCQRVALSQHAVDFVFGLATITRRAAGPQRRDEFGIAHRVAPGPPARQTPRLPWQIGERRFDGGKTAAELRGTDHAVMRVRRRAQRLGCDCWNSGTSGPAPRIEIRGWASGATFRGLMSKRRRGSNS